MSSWFQKKKQGDSHPVHDQPLDLSLTACDMGGAVRMRRAGLSSKYVYILVGTSVAVLLCLLLLVLLLVRRRRQRKHESLHSKGGEQRPQERLNPAADITEGTPDEATVCAPPEKNRETPSPSPDAGDAQEVTYASWTPPSLSVGFLWAPGGLSPSLLELTSWVTLDATP
ncbi:leukocyte-associated immunoglobulin-like receptor 1 [Myotis lucifugus]|uniref:leukocyte-associated immunoglobulin-like receptor 1 n=1 Tax=Myotis lucifugus TaxID=59463 RepID=UPI000CCC7F0D|nr:leukocyte-associated immunoglobulin-like receptor 1 [Myotis lucifugus]